MENKMLERALAYLEKGISVFPLVPGGKTPLSEALPLVEGKSSWNPFRDAHATREQVIQWWTKYPTANIGGVMGKISGLICLDQDVAKNDGFPILDEDGNPTERGDISGFPATLSAITWSGGSHSFYKHVEGIATRIAFRKKVDIKSDGSYVVLAPSVVNGESYVWNDNWEYALDSLEPFPVELVAPNQTATQKLDYNDLLSLSQGSRNEKMHKLVCSLYAKGHSDEEVVLLANAVNETYNPPIGKMRGDSPYELQNIINSARNFIGKSKGIKSSDRQDFKLVSWGEFNAREFPENPWRVEKLIPEFGITILAAPSGGRKSWVILDMIRAIASGEPFLGAFQTKKGAVLYIEQETPEQEVQRRGRQLRFPEMGMEGVFITSSSGEPLNLNSDENVRKLTEEVVARNISVVVIDTLRSVAGGLKEEKAEEVRAFFNRFKPMAERGIAVIFLDHTRKPRQFENRSKPAMDQILGSQDKIASVANVLMLGPSSEADTITLHQMKLKGGKEEKPFIIKMRDEGDEASGKKTYLEHGGGFDEEAYKIEQAKSLITEYLDEQKSERTAKEIIEALEKQVGKTNVEKALKEMRETDDIKSARHGRAYIYWTEAEPQGDSWGEPDASS